jgi:hypothetical protein
MYGKHFNVPKALVALHLPNFNVLKSRAFMALAHIKNVFPNICQAWSQCQQLLMNNGVIG